MAVEQRTPVQFEVPRPPAVERLGGAAQVRVGILHRAADRFEGAARRGERRRDARVEGDTAEVRTPCHPDAGEVPIERLPEDLARIRQRKRRPGIRPRDGTQHEGGVGGASRHRPLHRDRVPRGLVGPDRNPAGRGPEADDPAETRRIAERAAVVAAVRDRDHPGRERHRRAPAAPPAGLRRVPGVPGGAEHRVERLRAGAELRGVRLADGDRARRPQTLHDQRVLVGDEVGKDRGPEGRADAAGEGQVLVGDRKPVERPERVACRHRPVRLLRFREQHSLREEGDDRVQARVDVMNPGEVRPHHLDRRNLAAGDAAGEFGRRGRAEFGHQATAVAGSDPATPDRRRSGPRRPPDSGCAGCAGCRRPGPPRCTASSSRRIRARGGVRSG